MKTVNYLITDPAAELCKKPLSSETVSQEHRDVLKLYHVCMESWFDGDRRIVTITDFNSPEETFFRVVADSTRLSHRSTGGQIGDFSIIDYSLMTSCALELMEDFDAKCLAIQEVK